MTFKLIWWGVFIAAAGIFFIGMALTKAIWPWLKANRWVLQDWEDWR